MTNSKSDRSHIIAAGPAIAIAPFILRKPLLALLATLLLLVPFLAPLTAMADVYRWVEDDGTVNYGEREPRDRDYTVISRSASKEDANKGNNGICQ